MVYHSVDLFILGLIGLVGGALLASTGMIGPFLIPVLMFLGFPSGLARGTCLISELLVTFFSVVVHGRAKNLNKRVILAFSPGAVVVVLGAVVSIQFSESFMRLAIALFEVVIGVVMIYSTWTRLDRHYSKEITNKTLIKLTPISGLAGFVKGFFGAGWGPIGVGLFTLMEIDPRIVVGSSLFIRLFLDSSGGLTYTSMGLVDFNSALIISLTGCITVLPSVRLMTKASGRTIRTFLGGIIILLGVLLVTTGIG